MTSRNFYPSIEINIACEGWDGDEKLRKLASAAIMATIQKSDAKFPQKAELSLLFSDDRAIQRLNAMYRNIDKPTNVLSFPQLVIKPGEMAGKLMGDLTFALQTITGEAEQENKTFDSHLTHLIIHGFLHIIGYDHENDDDAEIMEKLEIAALASLGIENPYVEHPGAEQ